MEASTFYMVVCTCSVHKSILNVTLAEATIAFLDLYTLVKYW